MRTLRRYVNVTHGNNEIHTAEAEDVFALRHAIIIYKSLCTSALLIESIKMTHVKVLGEYAIYLYPEIFIHHEKTGMYLRKHNCTLTIMLKKANKPYRENIVIKKCKICSYVDRSGLLEKLY